jgi:mannose-1-phosphate guanylyltransferase
MRHDPNAVIGMFPSDHVIADEGRYRETLKKGIALAAAGNNIVVLGIRPSRPETGYGYIVGTDEGATPEGSRRVERFVEKPLI